MRKLNMVIHAKDRKSHISPEIYGHFSEHLGRCIYNGIYVGTDSKIPNKNGIRTDVLEAFRQIHMPVLRWPGGCFADEYHWMDGIGEKTERRKMINTNWGAVTEDNSFGTHEFFELCEEIGCAPYLAVNLGSGTVREMAEWIEYITCDGDSPMANLRRKNGREKPWKLKYVGIGNESWGCGGSMRPEYYADEYRRYQSFCKNFSGNELYKIACGPNGGDFDWTDKLMANLNEYHTKAISLHYYTVPTNNWNAKGSALDFDEEEYYSTIFNTLYMDELIEQHCAVMSRHDHAHKIGLIVDEWGCWYDVEPGTHPGFLYQQNTMRDAIVAACNLNIFNHHSDRVVMANLAQAVNVLQALILTEGEKMVKTPTYHVFDLYQGHHDGELVYSFCEESMVGKTNRIPMISHSASVKDNVLTVTIANCAIDDEAEIFCAVNGMRAESADVRLLTGDCHAHNDFDFPERVTIRPHSAVLSADGFTVKIPPCSVVLLTLR